MDLIERYLHVVSERLPEGTRDDVKEELRANIEDMLPENATEDDVRAVLEKLGNPKKLAAEYSQVKRYLIGPDLYDRYLYVLKLVLSIVAVAFSAIALFGGVFNLSAEDTVLSEMIVRVFADMLNTVVQGVIQGALWVTIVFVILERIGVSEGKMPFIKKKWSPDELLTLQVSNKRRISRRETVFSMICTILFTSLFCFKPQFIGWYTKDNTGFSLVEPLFVVERLQAYMPAIIIFAIAAVSILMWKLILMEWSFPLAAVNAAYNIALCVLVYFIVSDTSLFNQEFISKSADLFKTSLSQINTVWFNGIKMFGVIFIAFSIWDSATGFIKASGKTIKP